jgi:hypothetical protein
MMTAAVSLLADVTCAVVALRPEVITGGWAGLWSVGLVLRMGVVVGRDGSFSRGCEELVGMSLCLIKSSYCYTIIKSMVCYGAIIFD